MLGQSEDIILEEPPYKNSGVPLVSSKTAFDEHAGPSRLTTPVASAISGLSDAFNDMKFSLDDDELDDVIKDIESQKKLLEKAEIEARSEKMQRHNLKLNRMLARLDDPEARNFGQAFLANVAQADMGCEIATSGLTAPAVYFAYSLAPENRGLVNKIKVNPDRADNALDFYLSKIHESIHGLQRLASSALQCSPFNPDTRAVVHPEDWNLLLPLSERDAFGKTAFAASKLVEFLPELSESSQNSTYSLHQFNKIRENAVSLKDAMVSAARESLAKQQKIGGSNYTYADFYNDVAVQGMSAALYWRKQYGIETTFVRLERDDFRSIGDYGVGPNTMGEYFMEPLLLQRPTLTAQSKDLFDTLMREHDVPPLEDCQTLSQFMESQNSKFSYKQPYYQNLGSPSPRMAFA